LEIYEVDVLPEVEPMPEPKSYARRLLKGSAIVFTAFIASEVVGVFMRMFLSRSLTVPEYGLFFEVYVFISIFALLRDPGLGSSLTKHIAEFAVHKKFAKIKSSIAFSLLAQAAIGIIISVILIVFSDQIALTIFKTASASLPFKILAIWFFLEAFRAIVSCVTQGLQNMKMHSLFNFSYTLIIFLSVLCFVGILGLGVSGVALAYPVAAVIVGISGLALLAKKYPEVFGKKISMTKPLTKKLLVFAIPIFLGGIGGQILTYTDTFLITIFRTPSDVAYYQAAQPSAKILWYTVATLTVVLYPMISELWAKNRKDLLGRPFHFLIKFSFILIIPVVFIFIVFPEIVLNLLFGAGYTPGAVVLQIFGVAALIYPLYDILVTVIVGIGRPNITAKVVGAMAVFNVIGDLILIPPYGIVGAAVASLAAFILGLILLIRHARRLIEFTMPTQPLLKLFAGGALTLLLILGLKSVLVLPAWLEAVTIIVPSLLFYVAWIIVTKVVTKDDLRFIQEIVPLPKWIVKAAEKILR